MPLLLFLSLLLPRAASATAGFAESYRHYDFVPGVELVVGHGDACREAPGNNCLYLQSSKGNIHLFRVGLPDGPQASHAIIQDETQVLWQILELPTLVPVFESKDQSAALTRWREMGKQEPRWVGFKDAGSHFKETPASLSRNRPLLDFGFFALLFIPVLGAVGLGWILIRRRRSSSPGRVSGS